MFNTGLPHEIYRSSITVLNIWNDAWHQSFCIGGKETQNKFVYRIGSEHTQHCTYVLMWIFVPMCSSGFSSLVLDYGLSLFSGKHCLQTAHPHIIKKVLWTLQDQMFSKVAFHIDCNEALGHSIPFQPGHSSSSSFSTQNSKGVVGSGRPWPTL